MAERQRDEPKAGSEEEACYVYFSPVSIIYMGLISSGCRDADAWCSYERLEANIPKMLMQHSDLAFPDDEQLFPRHAVITDYLERYADDVRIDTHHPPKNPPNGSPSFLALDTNSTRSAT